MTDEGLGELRQLLTVMAYQILNSEEDTEEEAA